MKTSPPLLLTPSAKHVISLADSIAREMGGDYVATEHLLLAIVRKDYGVTGTALRSAGITEAQIIDSLKAPKKARRKGGFQPKDDTTLPSEVRQARAHLTATGWSYRTAAPEVGVTWQHLAQVLTGLRHSKSLVARVLSLPHR